MKRRSATIAALGGVLLTVTACGGANGNGDSDSDGGAAAGGETRTVTSTFTDEKVEIPKNPKRVVALWRTGSMLTELGVKPVAALEDELLESEIGPKAYDRVSDVPTVGSWEGVDVEKVIQADPDLIIGMDNGSLGIQYEEISEVAPTVILDIAEPTDVWDEYPTVADLVGRKSDFEQRNRAVNEDLAAIDKEYGDVLADAGVTSLRQEAGQIWVDTSKALTERRLDAAGFGYNPDYTDDPERYVAELAPENLPSLKDSEILFYDVGLDGETTAENRKLLGMKSFERLPAVEAGHAYPITSGTIYTFAAAEQQVADLRKAAESYAADQ